MLICAPLIANAEAPVVSLNARTTSVDAWPAITVLHDPAGKLVLNDVLAAADKFVPPTSAYETLGLRHQVMWLRIPLSVAATDHPDWLLNIDYALLHRIDVYFMRDGQLVREWRMGMAQPSETRPMQSRTPAVEIDLKPGNTQVLFLRVDTPGAMIVPITLNTPAAFHARAIDEQMLQGALTSLVVALLVYSLLQWHALGDRLYLKYAGLVLTSGLFSIHFFGIGEQYFWTDSAWFSTRMAGATSLFAALATALFVEDVLGKDMGRRARLAIRVVAGLLAIAGVAYLFAWIDIGMVSIVMSALGLLPSLLGLPGAVARMRRGDGSGVYLIAAWVAYAIASAVMIGVVRGTIGVNFWTMHSFQIGATIDMLIFMRIAILRSATLHAAAERATQERDSLLSLAHTDPLTGLLNRRGFQITLLAALQKATPDRMVALYMLDLDHFKPVNDQHGHDVGDELLVVVGSRLRATMRGGDIVARLGGDEFVIMATALKTEQLAHDLGKKILDAFSTPFNIREHICKIGVTVGYAVAPQDGTEALALLKSADAAMYAGKQSGRNCVRRIGVPELQKAKVNS